MSLNEACNELRQWGTEFLAPISAKGKNRLAHFILALDTAITVNQQSLDKDNIKVCLSAIAHLKNMKWSRCKDEHLIVFMDFFTKDEIALLFGIKVGSVYAQAQYIKKKMTKRGAESLEPSAGTDLIKDMSEEEFSGLLRVQTRLSALKSLSSSNVEITKWMLTNERDQKFKELESMWQLCKDWLVWWTGECIPKLVKRIAQSRPPFDVKILAAEVADDKYNELVKKYQEVKPRVDVSQEMPDEVVKTAKRRGKWKEVRQREEKEAKLLKASTSIVPPQTESAESASNSVGEEGVSSNECPS